MIRTLHSQYGTNGLGVEFHRQGYLMIDPIKYFTQCCQFCGVFALLKIMSVRRYTKVSFPGFVVDEVPRGGPRLSLAGYHRTD